MSRSTWKGVFIQKSLLKNIKKPNKSKIRTWSRGSTIIPSLIGIQLEIYNGKEFIELNVTEEMVGHKLGEFIPTRIKFSYKKKNKLTWANM
jgi:small subunit ribosomal protein S19